ncbi:MAG: hypothetical protein V4598_18040 [Bdellovibrionota bacterium]
MMTKFAVLSSLLFATQAIAYEGSTFNEIKDVIDGTNFVPQSEIAKEEHAVYQAGKLPQYGMNMGSVFGKGKDLKRDAQRTISEKEDSYPRIEKLLHPNGVCLAGKWTMTEESDFSGAFKKGTSALFIGRASVAMEKTTSKSDRGFGFAGKIFPTTNPDQRVPTTNFFAVDVLMGENTPRFLETAVTNEPETGFNIMLVRLGLKIANTLKLVDQSPMFRPVTPIAKIGEAPEKVKSPKWMKISAADGTHMNDEKDFRREVLKAVSDNTVLKFKVEVSNTTKDNKKSEGWKHIGFIEIDHAKVSYGCDRQLHFAHPKHND